MRRPPKAPAGVVLALGVAALLACSSNGDKDDDNQFREDVLQCEEAVARLQRCCPSFDVGAIECRYHYSYSTGCGTTTRTRSLPAFDTSESKCVQNTSCSGIVSSGVCERALDGGVARTTIEQTDTDEAGTPTAPMITATPPRGVICP